MTHEQLTFATKIISGRRLTIDKVNAKALDLQEGDEVLVTIVKKITPKDESDFSDYINAINTLIASGDQHSLIDEMSTQEEIIESMDFKLNSPDFDDAVLIQKYEKMKSIAQVKKDYIEMVLTYGVPGTKVEEVISNV